MADVYTPETLAEHWSCSSRNVRKLIAEGQLGAFRLGGKLLRIRKEAVEEFEQEHKTASGSVGALSSPGPKQMHWRPASLSELLRRARAQHQR